MIIPIKDANRVFFTYNGTQMPVRQIYYNDSSVSNIKIFEDYYSQYLTFEPINSGVNWQLSFTPGTNAPSATFYYSVNDGSTWSSLSGNTGVNANGKIIVKANLTKTGNGTSINNCWHISANSTQYRVYGNIMSLIYGDNFVGNDSLNSSVMFTFANLFNGGKGLVDASNLILPNNTAYGCYYGMFSGCYNLTNSPMLKAKTMSNYCYGHMFSGCYNLTNAPELPADVLAQYCYESMFVNCTSLATAPKLYATVLAENCYNNMFSNTAITESPDLVAETLAAGCYRQMFRYCSSLTNIKCLAEDISATDCTTDWLKNVANSGTFHKISTMTSWTTGTSGIPSGWTVQDTNSSPNNNYVTCPTCDGAGWVLDYNSPCSECNGTSMVTCDMCGGSGNQVCQECGGEGQIWDDEEEEYIECPICQESGTTACDNCQGAGEVPCEECDAEGYLSVTCPTCNGAGRILN